MKIFQNKLLRSGASYSIASTCSAVCGMIIGFLNMRWLGPEILGIWQSVTIIEAYLPIVQLGIQSGLNLELPILLGAKEDKKALQLVQTALSYACFLALLLSIMLGVVLWIVYNCNPNPQISLGLTAVSLIVIMSCFRLHYIATFRSAKAFGLLAKIFWIDFVVSIALIYFIYKFQYYGLLFFYVVKYAVFTLYMYLYAPYRNVKPKFYKESFMILLKRGVFMTFFNEIKGIVESLPRVVLLKVGGTTLVGLFNPALTIGNCLNLIPGQIASFLHPQFGIKYGQTKHAKDMWPYLKKLSIYVPICVFPVALLAWIIMPYLLEMVFPKYIDSLQPIRIMLIGYLFSTTYFSKGFLITIKAYKVVMFLQLIDILFFGGLTFIMLFFCRYNTLVTLSFALSISYFITYIINILVVRRVLFLPKYNLSYEN